MWKVKRVSAGIKCFKVIYMRLCLLILYVSFYVVKKYMSSQLRYFFNWMLSFNLTYQCVLMVQHFYGTVLNFYGTAFLAIFQRHRHQNKVPVPAQDLHWLKNTDQYRPKIGHDEYFSLPVLDRLVSISTGLVPEPALCPGAGAAERSQETLYMAFYWNNSKRRVSFSANAICITNQENFGFKR